MAGRRLLYGEIASLEAGILAKVNAACTSWKLIAPKYR
jgi:hypothetical protein